MAYHATTGTAHKLARMIYHLITVEWRTTTAFLPPRSAKTGDALNAGFEGKRARPAMILFQTPFTIASQ